MRSFAATFWRSRALPRAQLEPSPRPQIPGTRKAKAMGSKGCGWGLKTRKAHAKRGLLFSAGIVEYASAASAQRAIRDLRRPWCRAVLRCCAASLPSAVPYILFYYISAAEVRFGAEGPADLRAPIRLALILQQEREERSFNARGGP